MKDFRKVRKIGGSLGVTLPKEFLAEMGVGEGDSLYLVRTSEGIELTARDPEITEVLEIGRKFMRRYPNAMKKLAED